MKIKKLVTKKSIGVVFLLLLMTLTLAIYFEGCLISGLLGNCPDSKCRMTSQCVCKGIQDFFGIDILENSCRWKDSELKIFYKEINPDEARGCLTRYIEENKSKHSKLEHIESVVMEDESTYYCHGFSIEVDKKDSYCYYYQARTDPITGDEAGRRWELSFLVGAQSCGVYPDKKVFDNFSIK